MPDYLSKFLRWIASIDANHWTAIAAVITAAAAVSALIVAVRQLSEAKRLARIQHLLQLVNQFSQNPMVQYRQAAAQAFKAGDIDIPATWEVLNFVEELGLLSAHGYLSYEDVWEMFGYSLFPLYFVTKSMIEDYRKTDPNALTNLLELHRKLAELEQMHGGSCHQPSPSYVDGYWESELGITTGTPPKRRGTRKKVDGESLPLLESAIGSEAKPDGTQP